MFFGDDPCGRQPGRWSRMIPASCTHALCILLLWAAGRADRLISNEWNMADVMLLPRLDYKNIEVVSLSWVGSLCLSLRWLKSWERQEGAFSVRLKALIFLVEPWYDCKPSRATNPQVQTPGKSWVRTTQLSYCWLPDPQWLWDNMHLFFSVAKFGNDLYAEITSTYICSITEIQMVYSTLEMKNKGSGIRILNFVPTNRGSDTTSYLPLPMAETKSRQQGWHLGSKCTLPKSNK